MLRLDFKEITPVTVEKLPVRQLPSIRTLMSSVLSFKLDIDPMLSVFTNGSLKLKTEKEACSIAGENLQTTGNHVPLIDIYFNYSNVIKIAIISRLQTSKLVIS